MTQEEKIKTTPWRLEDYISTEEDILAHIQVAIEENNPEFLADILGIAAKKRGMSKVARSTGLNRESLYKSLSVNGNPELSTLMKILPALGLHMKIERASI